MRYRWALLLCLLFAPTLAIAGPNEGGVLLLHSSPNLVYSAGVDYCGLSGLQSCADVRAEVPSTPDAPIVFHVVAAFPDTSLPRLKSLAFGVDYDSSVAAILDHGSCGGFEVTDKLWPRPGAGVALSWDLVQTSRLTDVYWFVAQVLDRSRTDTIALTEHPVQGAVFVDDAAPPQEDAVAGFGTLGFGVPGTVPECVTDGQQIGYSYSLDNGLVRLDAPPPAPDAAIDVELAQGCSLNVEFAYGSGRFVSGDIVRLRLRAGRLYINDSLACPLPAATRTAMTLYQHQRLFGQVPLVRQYIACHEGDSLALYHEAEALWRSATSTIVKNAHVQFVEHRRRGLSKAQACQRVIASLNDHPAVERAEEQDFRDGRCAFRVSWTGAFSELTGTLTDGIASAAARSYMTADASQDLIEYLRKLGVGNAIEKTVYLRSGSIRAVSRPRGRPDR